MIQPSSQPTETSQHTASSQACTYLSAAALALAAATLFTVWSTRDSDLSASREAIAGLTRANAEERGLLDATHRELARLRELTAEAEHARREPTPRPTPPLLSPAPSLSAPPFQFPTLRPRIPAPPPADGDSYARFDE